MLVQLCVNSQGLYFCGDTAQTIANGAAFRFEHTRATCYEHAVERAASYASRNIGEGISISQATSQQPNALLLAIEMLLKP